MLFPERKVLFGSFSRGHFPGPCVPSGRDPRVAAPHPLPHFTGPDGAPISHLPEMVRAPLLGGRWVGFCIKFGKTLRVMFTGSGWVIKKPVLVT